MKHLINDRHSLIEEMIEGLVAAYNGTVVKVDNVNGIMRKEIKENKVTLLVGGGADTNRSIMDWSVRTWLMQPQ